MESWPQLKEQIRQWSKCVTSDEDFYNYLKSSVFELDADRRVADLFIIEHDNGEWSHAIYHRV